MLLRCRPLYGTVRSVRHSSTNLTALTKHYVAQGDSASDAASLATQELVWLEQHARKIAGAAWSSKLSSMISDMVDLNTPLAYVLGTQPFHPLPNDLLVRSPTLIPRPETEHWVGHLANLLRSSHSPDSELRILDIGTGTGCIPLALIHHLRDIPVHATAIDLSQPALSLARANLARCPPPRADSRLTILEADLFSDNLISQITHEPFDLVVSNPPYITRADYENLPASVKAWEDRLALVGSHSSEPRETARDDALVFYRKIASLLPSLLDMQGRKKDPSCPVVALEVGVGQAEAVAAMLEAQGLRTETLDDPWGLQRSVSGYGLPVPKP